MGKYWYHPIGDNAKMYVDGTATPSQKPHTYDWNGSKSHGIGKLDWGLEPGTPIYSMTDGTCYSIIVQTSSGGKGYQVYIKTDRTTQGKPICIRYIEMRGLGDSLADAIGVDRGDNSFPGVYSANSVNVPISQGELIGYANDWYAGYSTLHTDMFFESQGDSSYNDPNTIPQIEDGKLSSDFTLEDTGNTTSSDANLGGQTFKLYKVTCQGKTVGSETGFVPLQGYDSTIYPVYPFVPYLVQLQTPVQISTSTAGNGGSTVANGTGEAPDSYFSETFTADDTELRQIGNACMGEIPPDYNDLTRCRAGIILYAKLVRRRRCEYGDISIPSLMSKSVIQGYSGSSINSSSLSAMEMTEEEYLEQIRIAYCTPYLGMIEQDAKCKQIANGGPFYNMGYSGLGYSNSSSIESELEARIIANNCGSVGTHNYSSSGFLGCVGNTGYWYTKG